MNKVKKLPKNRQTDFLLSEKKESTGISIPKSVLFDVRLSPKAKGLLCIILALPENRSISIEGLCKTSDKIGKRSIQSGIKELAQNGYLKLVPIYDEKGKFKGRQYQIVATTVWSQTPAHFRTVLKPHFPSQNTDHFKTVQKLDSPKIAFSSKSASNSLTVNGKPPFRTVLKKDSPKTASIISTVIDLKINNNKDDAKTGFSVAHFFPTLLQDVVWKDTFVGQILSNQTVLSLAQLDFLLQHFKQTSLWSSVTYKNLVEVKKHFSNWYRLHLSQKSLVSFIQREQSAQRNTRKRAFDLVKHSENIFKKLKKRGYSSENEVLRALAALQKHKATYAETLPFLRGNEEVDFLKVLVSDIEKISEKVAKANEQGKLGWFCG